MRPMLMIHPKECRLKRVNGGIDSDWSGKPTAGHILTAISVLLVMDGAGDREEKELAAYFRA